MATRVSYPVEVKKKAIEMRLDGIPVKEVMDQLNIRNKTQVETWMRWYRSGQWNRLEQPVLICPHHPVIKEDGGSLGFGDEGPVSELKRNPSI
ncbi:Uncharacterised protein [Actinobacillus pleuropneumoniae]|nr:Uncharacterised protein [Actinobacillus pleuropneumoniae]